MLPALPLLLLLLLLPPAAPQCPDIFPTLTNKIINGLPSLPTHEVSLSSPPTPFVRRCTAARISQSWALTAAHCLVNTSWTARTDGNNITNGNHATILRVFSHPRYRQPTDRRFDIALLHLDASPIGDAVLLLNDNPALPEPHAFVRVSGYGASTTASPAPHGTLAHVDIPTVNFTLCSSLYAGTPNLGRLDPSQQLCAGYLAGGCDACSGDSGGPIIQFDASGAAVLVGLVSASRGCALPNFPGIAVRVDPFLDWLRGLGATFQTGQGVQVFEDGAPARSATPTPRPTERDDVDVTPVPGDGVRKPAKPPRGDGDANGDRRGDGDGDAEVGIPVGPVLPPSPSAAPSQPGRVFDDEDDREDEQDDDRETDGDLTPSSEVDNPKGAVASNDVSGSDIAGSGINAGIIVGAVVGGLVLIAVVLVAVVLLLRRGGAQAENDA